MNNNISLPLFLSLNTIAPEQETKSILQIYDPLSKPHPHETDGIVPKFIVEANHLKAAILENTDSIYQILSEIQPFKVTAYEIERSIKTLDKFFGNSKYYSKTVNQISVFMPSNLPLYSFILFGIIPSFMAKQKLIIKPNQHMREKNTFGKLCDVLNIKNLFHNIEIVHDETQKFMDIYVPNSDIVIFTGYNKNRDKILSMLKPGSLLIYNGSGHNPIVVGRNANIEKAAKDACYAKFFNSGQDCAGPDAILVQKDAFDSFMEKYLIEIEGLKVGTYDGINVDVGPISRKSELQKFLNLLHDVDVEKIKAGGVIDMKQNILYPTVICDELNEKSNMQEIFGPISFVYSYDKDDDVNIYFNDKNGTYLRNKMYVSLYGQNNYVESRDDNNCAKNNGIGIILHNKNVHDFEEGDKAYGGYSLGASGVYYKINETTFQKKRSRVFRKIVAPGCPSVKALPVYVPEIIALHVDRQLFSKSKEKNLKKGDNRKMVDIVEAFKVISQNIFDSNLAFGFLHKPATIKSDNDLNVFICVRERSELQEAAFKEELKNLKSENNNVLNYNLSISVVEISKIENYVNDFVAGLNKDVVHALAGRKIGSVGDKVLLSSLTSIANKALKML